MKLSIFIIVLISALLPAGEVAAQTITQIMAQAKSSAARGDNVGAAALLEQAWQASAADPAATPDDRLALADALVSRLIDVQRFADAARIADTAMPLAKQATNQRIVAEALAVFPVPLIRLGRAAEAEALLIAAEAARQNVRGDSRGLAVSIAQRRSVALATQGRVDDARAVLAPLVGPALAADFPDPVRGLVIPQTLAGIHIYQGRFADAVRVLEAMRPRALALWTSPRQRAEFLETLGEAYRGTGQNTTARGLYQEALQELAMGQSGPTTTAATLHANIARVSLLLGEVQPAQTAADRAVAIMAERAAAARAADGTVSALDQRQSQLVHAMALDAYHAGAGPARDAAGFRLLQQGLALTQPDAAQMMPAALTDARAALRADEALVLMLEGTEAIHVIGLTKDGFAWHRLAQSNIESCPRFARLRAGLAPGQPLRCLESVGEVPADAGFDLAAAYELWRDLLAPLGPAVLARPRWIIATAGAPAALPLGVLLTASPQPGGFAAQAWLGAEKALAYLPSAADLVRLRALPAAPPPSQLIGFGAPCIGALAGPACAVLATAGGSGLTAALAALPADFSLTRSGGQDADPAAFRLLPALPGAAAELQALARGFPGRSMLAMGPAATEAALRRVAMRPGSVLALATHGLAAGSFGLARSTLVLSPGVGETPMDDGLIGDQDVRALALPDAFVILTACNLAGVRSIERLDPWHGFARALFAAGARALLISQFEVLDAAAPRLSAGMLRQWQASPANGRAEALRRTIADMLADPTAPQLHHPRAWAAMVLVGTPD